jgi:hypothetical protein
VSEKWSTADGSAVRPTGCVPAAAVIVGMALGVAVGVGVSLVAEAEGVAVVATEGDSDVVAWALPFRAPQPPTTKARTPTASPRATMLGIGLRHRCESELEVAGARPIQWVLPISGSPFPKVDLPCTGDRTEEDAPGRDHVVSGLWAATNLRP